MKRGAFRLGVALVVSVGVAMTGVATSQAVPLAAKSSHTVHHLSANPNLAFVLFVLGIAGIVFELLHPGLNVPGVAGVISFVVSLVLLGSLPVNAGGIVLVDEPGASSQTVSLPRPMLNLDGQKVESVTLAPASGVVLKNT